VTSSTSEAAEKNAHLEDGKTLSELWAQKFDWDLFSNLLNDVFQFCMQAYRKDLEDVLELKVIDSPIYCPEWQGTAYNKRVQLSWKAKDMIQKHVELYSDWWGLTRNHWGDLLEAFPQHDLRGLIDAKGVLVHISLTKPGEPPFRNLFRRGYLKPDPAEKDSVEMSSSSCENASQRGV